MKGLAQPAPEVEAATSERAPVVECAATDCATEADAATADRAEFVDPAVLFDPKIHAPTITQTQDGNKISVQCLRGKSGADFEGVAAVLKGGNQNENCLAALLPWCFRERDFVSFGEIKRYAVIKNDCCFIFIDENELQPLYAIPLHQMTTIVEDPKNPDKCSVTISPTSVKTSNYDFVTVLLKDDRGGLAYQFTFDKSNDWTIVKRFCDIVAASSKQQERIVTGSLVKSKIEDSNAKNSR
jgi:hypothetical protein